MTVQVPSGAESVVWDLSDLYGSLSDPSIDKDLDRADSLAKEFAESYRNRISELSPEQMLKLLEEYESILELSQKAGTYAYLIWSTNSEDSRRGALLQKTTERSSRVYQQLLFLHLEWADTPVERARALTENPLLERYRHWLTLVRRYQPYLLSEPEERILSEKSISGRDAWRRFFGEVHGAARYEWEGEELPQQSILNKLYDPDREIRRRAAGSFTSGLKHLERISTFIFNSILSDKSSDDTLRTYPDWISARNLDNQVDDATVKALIEAVTSRYDIVARYYRLKRKLLGLDSLFDYDRYAPLPAADRRYTWEEAKSCVLSAYTGFHPRMGRCAEEFFDRQWIDAAVRSGKRGGAYSHGAVPSIHPYLFLNYEGSSRDLMTLAHEMGHGIHQMLSREQGILQADTPLTTAETASVFGEMIVFQDLLSRETDDRIRLSLLVRKLEDSFATVFRQIAMNRFEEVMHHARRTRGELSTEQLCEIWQETQEAMFQNSVTLTDDYRRWWSYIPHFISTPGYVYAYAFGELLVLALHTRYQEAREGFPELYLDMLKAGGSVWPHDLLKPLGVDLKDPDFWSKGLELLAGMVQQAEELAG